MAGERASIESELALPRDSHWGHPTKESVQMWFDTFVEEPPEVLTVVQNEHELLSIRIRLASNLVQVPLKTPWGNPVEILTKNDGTLLIKFQSNGLESKQNYLIELEI